jgi:hypothetical protein
MDSGLKKIVKTSINTINHIFALVYPEVLIDFPNYPKNADVSIKYRPNKGKNSSIETKKQINRRNSQHSGENKTTDIEKLVDSTIIEGSEIGNGNEIKVSLNTNSQANESKNVIIDKQIPNTNETASKSSPFDFNKKNKGVEKKLLNNSCEANGKKIEALNKKIKLISPPKCNPEQKRKKVHKPELSGIFAIHNGWEKSPVKLKKTEPPQIIKTNYLINDTQDDLFDKYPNDSSSSPISPKRQSNSDEKLKKKTKKTLAKRSRPLTSSEDEGSEEEHGYVIKVKEADNKLSSTKIIGNNDIAGKDNSNNYDKENDDDDGSIISLDDW